jgi:hypothetical protein
MPGKKIQRSQFYSTPELLLRLMVHQDSQQAEIFRFVCFLLQLLVLAGHHSIRKELLSGIAHRSLITGDRAQPSTRTATRILDKLLLTCDNIGVADAQGKPVLFHFPAGTVCRTKPAVYGKIFEYPIRKGQRMKVHSVLENVTKDHICLEPYPHLVIDNCLPEDYYQKLAETYPDNETIITFCKNHPYRPSELAEGAEKQNARYDIPAFQALDQSEVLPQIWLDFVRFHTSREFYSQVAALLGDVIVRTYPSLEPKIGKSLQDFTTGVRFGSDSDVSLDCQIGINTPATERSSVRGVHTDAPEELYAMLLYMREEADDTEGGALQVYKWKDDRPRLFNNSEVEEDDAELVKTVDYKANRLVIFVNTDASLHAVTPREASTYTRKLVNIIGEVDKSIPAGLFQQRQKYPRVKKSRSPMQKLVSKARKKLGFARK